jgi:hypothetical protein
MRCAQAKEYEKQGRKVPSGFITPQWFFTFQYNRNLLLAAAQLKVHDIEQWAWMFARWAIADAGPIFFLRYERRKSPLLAPQVLNPKP